MEIGKLDGSARDGTRHPAASMMAVDNRALASLASPVRCKLCRVIDAG